MHTGKRLAKENIFKKGSRLREYWPSNSELLLEEMCEYFGTELNQAYVNPINGAKLVRESKPVKATHRKTGKERLLQFQFTKFSPFHSDAWLDVYNQTRGRRKPLDYDNAMKEIEAQIEEKCWNNLLELTDSSYIPGVTMMRFEKELYFAIFDVTKELPKEWLKPFLIHSNAPEILDRPPEVWIEYNRKPEFIGLRKKGDLNYDHLLIDFPQVNKMHSTSMSNAMTSYPMKNLKPENYIRDSRESENMPVFKDHEIYYRQSYNIHSEIPVEMTMGFIHQYLKSLCLGKTL